MAHKAHKALMTLMVPSAIHTFTQREAFNTPTKTYTASSL
jgi:hypothetical protein